MIQREEINENTASFFIYDPLAGRWRAVSHSLFALQRPENLHIDDGTGGTYYGCDQEWFGSVWQRMAGCGPSVASNIALYLLRTGALELPLDVRGKYDFIKLMELVWKYVTPTMRGVNKIGILSDGLQRLGREHGFGLESFQLPYPESRAARPALETVVRFVQEGLRRDCPVAFLNLSNGKVENLDNWHWVTIVSLESGADDGSVTAHIYDNSKAFPIDLRLWCETTGAGGGFVYFQKAQQQSDLAG